MTINKNCYVCDFPVPYSKTRSGKYYCEKHHVCAVEKTRILKKRGRKKLDEEQKQLSLQNKKENQRIYNRSYYIERVLPERNKIVKNIQDKKSTHGTF